MEKTIVAISTPLGKGAISIVRMSGEKALEISSKVFSPLKNETIEPRKMVLGNFSLEEGKEKCLMVQFKAPKTFTGEDLVEFQLHGGIIVTQKVLEKLLENGASLAEPGEFSKRAFLNGKISLDEAESISEVISSESEGELKCSLNLAGGKLKNDIKELQDMLTELLAKIEVTLDYPEEDIDEVVRDEVDDKLSLCKSKIENLIKNGNNAKFVKSGIDVAIVGKTNVGKSSLLNALLGEEKAIVTNIAGTTRDIVEGTIYYNGIKLNLIDTAGIRETEDIVEKIGVDKSKSFFDKADIVLFVLSAEESLDEEAKNILKTIKNRPHIVVVNKIDSERKLEKIDDELCVSAKTGENVEKIEKLIFDKVIDGGIDYNKTIVTNERHIEVLKESLSVISELYSSKDTALEIVDMLIKKLWNTLGKITGNTEHEDIIDMIFTKFCLGK